MDNGTASECTKLLAGYWEFSQWAAIVVGAIFLLMLWPLRRPGKAFAILLLGLYVTGALYFMKVYGELGFGFATAFGVVIFAGLVVMTVLYFFVFVRAK
jgi:hypothetical protein